MEIILLLAAAVAYLCRPPSNEMKKIVATEDKITDIRRRWGQDLGQSREATMSLSDKQALEQELRELDRIQGEAMTACGRPWTPHP